MATHPLSIIYTVRLRQVRNARVVVEIVRDDYGKQLASFSDKKGLVYSSNKPRPFMDDEDEQKILQECKDLAVGADKDIGSIELLVYGLQFGEGEVAVRYMSEDIYAPDLSLLCATWDPENGLRWKSNAHPVFKGDKKHIAWTCSDAPKVVGGIFSKVEPLL